LEHYQPFQSAKPTLYVLATPIGNLGDISTRALEVLRTVDMIAAEDTRVTATLLRAYHIKAPLISLREQNEAAIAQRIIEMLAAGKSVAQVSDAGTPAISDPGAFLCKLVRQAGFPIVPLPGACALVTALSVSGFTYPHFYFHGFLPAKSAQRKESLSALHALSAILIFYEAPHRIVATLKDCCAVLGEDRPAFLARELTKTFETLHQATLKELLYLTLADRMQQKGEFVLLIDAPAKKTQQDIQQADKVLGPLLEVLPLKQAVQIAAQLTAFSRNQLYERALSLK
jgi:16S rRNA (cytidine1402-2'-O)-methyltransferase